MVFVKKVVLYIEAVSPCLKIIYEDVSMMTVSELKLIHTGYARPFLKFTWIYDDA